MNSFSCNVCGQHLLFENTRCLSCGNLLAYLPERATMAALSPVDDGLWVFAGDSEPAPNYRLCANYTESHAVCNWAVPERSGDQLCASCQLTDVVPDLSIAGNVERWQRMEAAKRRLLYGLASLDLVHLNGSATDLPGPHFRFLADEGPRGEKPVLTGHANGIITINIAEADDPERERRRLALHEPYRTLLGHFRHESGHFYWDRLIADGNRFDAFRKHFGDERQDYGAALRRHYANPPGGDWPQQFISAYAGAHPWEDWAECWAHYLHMIDALETAAIVGLSVRPARGGGGTTPSAHFSSAWKQGSFDGLIEAWFALTYVLNNLNRGLGLGDAYPFVLSARVVDKLRFVHTTIQSTTGTAEAGPPAAASPQPPAASQSQSAQQR